MKAINYSRHALNSDQKRALNELGFSFSAKPKSVYFKNTDHFIKEVAGKCASVVVPASVALDLLLPENRKRMAGTTLLSWLADESARDRGNFAVIGVKIYKFSARSVTCDFHAVTPTVENSMATGKESPYIR